MQKYETLEKAMKEHDVSRKDLAKCLGVRYATVIDKLKGRTSFAFEDAEKIRDEYFPGYSLEELFEHKRYVKQ